MDKIILSGVFYFFLINLVSGYPKDEFFRAITVKNCGTSIVPASSPDRIVGGTKTKAGQYPWMVSLQEYDEFGRYNHVCGASVLNENWIITAAHCIDFINEPWKYQAVLGVHKLSMKNSPTAQKIKMSKIVLHKDFDDETFENDIALLKTAKPIDIAGSKGYVNGICLPKSNKDPTGYAKVTGWGHTYEDGENSDVLREVTVPIIPRDLCNESYDEDLDDDLDEIKETMICAGMAKRDSCQNDSGGPLIQTNSKGVSTLVGVVSHGTGCGQKYYPGVYTKVSSFNQWIQSTISK